MYCVLLAGCDGCALLLLAVPESRIQVWAGLFELVPPELQVGTVAFGGDVDCLLARAVIFIVMIP